ncbi:MAG: acetyltransferase [Anaerolineales bacterium]
MEENRKLLILGAGRLAVDVADMLEDIPGFEVAGFVVDQPPFEPGAQLIGRPVHWIDDLAGFKDNCQAVCAIGSTKRVDIITKVARMGFQFANVIHPSARVSRTASIGEGTIISGGVQIAAQTQIGRHVIINRGALIGPFDIIHDYVTIAPGANIPANVTIGPRTWVGLGANILEYITIGERCIIGAGSLVAKNVPDRVKVVGMPAMVVEREVEGL